MCSYCGCESIEVIGRFMAEHEQIINATGDLRRAVAAGDPDAVDVTRAAVARLLWAATAGGAKALGRDDLGVLRPGAVADLALLDAPSHLHLAYRPGVPLVAAVVKNGAPVRGRWT